MIKKEWITARNGFAVGEKLLYINPAFLHESMVFCLKDLNLELVTVPGRKDPIWKGVMENGSYGAPVYLEPEGSLYPLESRQFAFWSPFQPEFGVYPWVVVEPAGVNDHSMCNYSDPHMRKGLTYTTDTAKAMAAMTNGAEVIERPDWAEGLRL